MEEQVNKLSTLPYKKLYFLIIKLKYEKYI